MPHPSATHRLPLLLEELASRKIPAKRVPDFFDDTLNIDGYYNLAAYYGVIITPHEWAAIKAQLSAGDSGISQSTQENQKLENQINTGIKNARRKIKKANSMNKRQGWDDLGRVMKLYLR